VTHALLSLRARRPEAFAGGYKPLDAAAHTCAFIRGESVMVVVNTRPDPPSAAPVGPAGRWRSVLDRDGVAVLERTGASVAG
jgi:maltooligosyltrehalose synthase